MLMDLAGLLGKYGITPTGIIHIGAHDGAEYADYKRMGVPNIIMFEPQPHLAQHLRNMCAADHSVIVEQLAVGETPGTMDMYIETANKGMSSSLLKPKLHLEQYPWITFNSTIQVQVVSMDSYFYDKKLAPYNVINMDIQGYELQALRGAASILSKLDAVYTEVNRAELYEGCGQVEQLDTLLMLYGLERVETNWAGDTWGDALYVRRYS
jgi:FkbM family methyltransferase